MMDFWIAAGVAVVARCSCCVWLLLLLLAVHASLGTPPSSFGTSSCCLVAFVVVAVAVVVIVAQGTNSIKMTSPFIIFNRGIALLPHFNTSHSFAALLISQACLAITTQKHISNSSGSNSNGGNDTHRDNQCESDHCWWCCWCC